MGGCPHMCPWVGSHAPSCGRQLWGLPSRMEYLSPKGGITPASLRYNRLTAVAGVAGPHCLAGNPLLGCVTARLSSVAWMAPGDVCHGPRCSLAGLGPAVLEYRSCHWPVGSAGSPQCWGCRPLRPVPLLPSVPVCVLCPGLLGAYSPVCALCAVCVCCWWLCPSSSPPPNFFSFLFFAL